MSLGKMITIIDQNHDGAIVDIEEEKNNLNIDVKIKYISKYIDETYTLMRYKIINYSRIEFTDDGTTKYKEMDKIKNMGLIICSAEVGREHSLLIKVRSRTIDRGKLYIWMNKQNDIRIYDQEDNEIEYERFINICRMPLMNTYSPAMNPVYDLVAR